MEMHRRSLGHEVANPCSASIVEETHALKELKVRDAAFLLKCLAQVNAGKDVGGLTRSGSAVSWLSTFALALAFRLILLPLRCKRLLALPLLDICLNDGLLLGRDFGRLLRELSVDVPPPAK